MHGLPVLHCLKGDAIRFQVSNSFTVLYVTLSKHSRSSDVRRYHENYGLIIIHIDVYETECQILKVS